MTTTIRRNAGGRIVLDLQFFGPPPFTAAFGLTGWQIQVMNPSSRIKERAQITVTDAAQGEARIEFTDSETLLRGTQSFGVQIVRTSDGFPVGFPRVSLVIGSYSVEQLDGEPPYLQLSGLDGVQLRVSPGEPDVIYDDEPVPSNALQFNGDLLTFNGDQLIFTAA